MSGVLRIRRGVRDDWTGADFDSYTVLTELGATRPAALVTRARRGRPLRRAFRAALRTVTVTVHSTPRIPATAGRRFTR
ncbi:hypothetical protein GTY67_34370 [Streptomyces sp. SID8374]|uniref:hypothetical protein n=1 Tax=Streptomyces sp. SID8374 TaxID=2690354 RepID=UPI001370EB78|nr:hypothetical protein [Streptomyces sp. SID8374]MYX18436.1 hypothetical protein [Streptomyces sp. SID8374]